MKLKITILQLTNSNTVINLIVGLFVFVLVVDPYDALFRMKLPLFGLLLILCLLIYNTVLINSIVGIFVIYGACFLASLIGFFREANIDIGFVIKIYKSFIMLFLLLWAHKLKMVEKLYLPTMLIAIIVIVIYIITLKYPEIEVYIYRLLMDANEYSPLNMSQRKFIGISFISIFYKTSPLCLFVVGIALNNILGKNTNRSKNAILAIGASVVLFLGATRMNILSLFAIIGFEVLRHLWNSKFRAISIIGSFVGIIAMVLLVNNLINDKDEKSIEAKSTLSKAFYKKVDQDPLILVFGNGPGATFDSLGVRGKEAIQSEYTYQDMIRWFGIPLTIAIMLVYIYPISIILKKREKLKYSYTMIVAYILYLIVAGTNPLLISSTGMLALLVTYTYAFNPYYENALQR